LFYQINRTTGAVIVMVEQNIAATLRMVERAIALTSAELAAHEDLWSWFQPGA
jgi:ABC-type branched-subunit amino acid transport system ATPase component